MPENTTDWVCLNDHFLPKAEARLPIEDRGFRFGDGVFETIRVAHGLPWRLDYHIRRLEAGLCAIVLPVARFPFCVRDNLEALITKNALREGFVRITISRGAGSRGYLPTGNTPTVLIETLPASPYPASPYRLIPASLRKIPATCFPTQHKTSQGLSSTLAQMEAAAAGCNEALMLTTGGLLSEASGANLFWIKDSVLYTPSLNCDCLAGSVRDFLLQNAPMRVEEGAYPLAALEAADAVFLTNVRLLAHPVARLEPMGWEWPAAPVTLIREHIEAAIEAACRN